MPHKVIRTVKEYSSRIFSVIKVYLSMPDGSERTYDLVEMHNNAVTILPIDDEGNVYFVRQYRIGAQKELLELPAGKIEPGEDPLVTAEREVREETGMAAREMTHLGNFYMSPGYSSEYMYCYLARGLYPGALTPDADEFINIICIPLTEVRQMIDNREIEDSKTLALLMLVQKELLPFHAD